MNDCLYCAENESAIESLRALLARCEAAEAERDAARAEAARLREAIQFALDSPSDMSGEDIRILLAALRGEGR